MNSKWHRELSAHHSSIWVSQSIKLWSCLESSAAVSDCCGCQNKQQTIVAVAAFVNVVANVAMDSCWFQPCPNQSDCRLTGHHLEEFWAGAGSAMAKALLCGDDGAVTQERLPGQPTVPTGRTNCPEHVCGPRGLDLAAGDPANVCWQLKAPKVVIDWIIEWIIAGASQLIASVHNR